ncbi:MAG: hypothetical protein JEZ12_13095 [Desulfobacterium sp.]|nr:hypothetical protein [Desulfobacterium sp.]
MTFSELISKVQEAIQDPDYTDEMVGEILNRGLLAVASGVVLPDKYAVSPPLPDLYTEGTVETVVDSGVCDLPTDFNRGLLQVVNDQGEPLRVFSSFRKFLKENPGKEVGSVRICAVNGKKLLYRDIPSTEETLEVHYYAAPIPMEDEDDEPDCLQEGFHHPLLVGFACKEIFNLLEDGIDGPKKNTMYWEREFQKGVHDLGVFIGEDSDPDYMQVENEEDYID